MLRRIFGIGEGKHPLEEGKVTPSSNKMERFTQRARRALNIAQEETERYRHSSIRPEHILMGLWREDGSVAGRVLRELVSNPEDVETIIFEESEAFEGSEPRKGKSALAESDPDSLIRVVEEMAVLRPPLAQLDLAEDTKRALELTVDEARRMGNEWIGTEHLLLALSRQENTVALRALLRMGLPSDRIRERIEQVLKVIPRTASGRPIAESTADKTIPEEVLQKLRLRLIVHETDNRTFLVTLPFKQLADETNTALKNGQRGKFLTLDTESGTIEMFLDEEGAEQK
jgi:ATP-dependent Clp protease ATP-binding subunit ClpA